MDAVQAPCVREMSACRVIRMSIGIEECEKHHHVAIGAAADRHSGDPKHVFATPSILRAAKRPTKLVSTRHPARFCKTPKRDGTRIDCHER
jgi:hypothetical protein